MPERHSRRRVTAPQSGGHQYDMHLPRSDAPYDNQRGLERCQDSAEAEAPLNLVRGDASKNVQGGLTQANAWASGVTRAFA